MYYKVKVSYLCNQHTGILQKTTNYFICEAESVSDCETRIITELLAYQVQDPQVLDCTKTNLTDVYQDNNAQDFWQATLTCITIDDKGKCKSASDNILICADTFSEAYNFAKKVIEEDRLQTFITCIKKVNIHDYFPLSAESLKGY